MKNIIKTGLVLSSLFGAWYFSHTTSQNNLINDLAFENIEALAWDAENPPTENFKCYGWGEVDCYGIKVEVKYSGFSLTPESE